MKVVHIAKFDAFYKTGNYVADAFERQSVQVVKVSPETDFKEVRAIINRERPDFVLYGKALQTDRLIPWLKSRGIPSVFWLYDMAWGSSPVATSNRNHILRMNMHESDLFFSTDGGHDNQWTSIGVRHLTLRQGIHQPDHILVQPESVNFDILFIGHPYFPLRQKMIDFLKQKYGNKFRHVVQGLRGLALNRAVRSAKIVIADSYPSPNYWSNRVYEMTGRGGFVIHSDVYGLGFEFDVDRTRSDQHGDIVVFRYDSQFEELASIIDFYLSNDKRRESVRINGFRKCPTYDDRVAAMLDHIRAINGGT